MLIIDEIPAEFDLRYGHVKRNILIRQAYIDLYKAVTDIMLKAPLDRTLAALFTGVPGIGKSIFMIYLLCMYSEDDRFTDKRFAFECHSGSYHYYIPTDVRGKFRCISGVCARYCKLDEILLIADISEPRQPMNHAKWSLIFSSPNPLRYKEFMKTSLSITYTMPTWSEDEFLLINTNVEQWHPRFVKCGGVARFVLWEDGIASDPIGEIDMALQNKGAIVADYFFKNGFGNMDVEKSYALLHINPPCEEGKIIYDAIMPIHTFASDYVFSEIASKYKQGLVAEAIGLFNAGSAVASEKLGSISAGHLFEKICMWLVPISGKLIEEANPLLNRNAILTTPIWNSVRLPEIKYLPYNWKNSNLTSGFLYQPLICNLESGDAFCLISTEESFMLLVLQVTVGENHPIKVNGLMDIYLSFDLELRNKITRKVLLFVTPFDGKLKSLQPYHTKKGVVIINNNTVVSEFEQWVHWYVLAKEHGS